MKFSVTTYSYSKILKEKCDYLAICDKTKELGFDGIEFVQLERFDPNIDDMKAAREIREHCEKIGLEISSYTIGVDLAGEQGDAQLEKLLHYIDVAAELGTKNLRHDVCYALPKKHLYSYRDAIKVLVPRIRRATEYAKSKGIRTCTENHGYIFQAPERVEELILAVGSENYGWLCDLGNFLCVEADPIHAVATAAPYTFHVHAKDFLFKSGSTGICPPGFFTNGCGNYLRGTVIGHGVVPVRECVNILKKAGYDGWMTVEFEGMEDTIPAVKAGLDYLKSIV